MAQHPIVGYCKNNKKTNDSTLLILVGGPSGFRVPNHKIQKWISAIQIVMKLKKPSQIHLRLHPRESKKVIMQFEKELSLNNIQYTTLNSKEISIIDNICSYMGVIGSPSLALKIFRWASKETFALCLEDATIPGFYGSILSLGDTEGIKNIDENTVIDSEILIPPKNFSFEKRVKLKDILRNILV